MPLIMPIHVICNTPDDQLYRNIKANSARNNEWMKLQDEHNGVAILCGSGPSLRDSIDEIKELIKQGGKVFALNNAANYLSSIGIMADYQVILDARPETADLIGPAREHLFASQVHPDCFDAMPSAKIWHLQIENIDEYIPVVDGDILFIGGAASVGNTATCLAYSMGYRKMHCFGYDSSNKGESSHAIHQKMNDGEPLCSVRFLDKDYTCSITMKMQAERFLETGSALRIAGCDIEVHGYGLLPDMWNAPKEALTEREKYVRMWSLPEYRSVAPGELCAETFLKVVNPTNKVKVIDFGCGTGRGALRIHQNGIDVHLVDFTDNSRDEEAVHLPFTQCDISENIPLKPVKYGYCTDVMEHIEPEKVEKTINNLMHIADEVFFQISLVPDSMGALIGQDLHLSVHSYGWWMDKFASLGYHVKWSQDDGISAMYHVVNT